MSAVDPSATLHPHPTSKQTSAVIVQAARSPSTSRIPLSLCSELTHFASRSVSPLSISFPSSLRLPRSFVSPRRPSTSSPLSPRPPASQPTMPTTTAASGVSAVNVKSGLHELLTPDNCCVVFIDHQPAMTFGVRSIDHQSLINNVVGLAKAARVFHIPVVLTAVESASFSGAIWPQLTTLFPEQQVVERSSMNSWEDAGFVAAVKATKRTKLVICALWTEVCLAFPALCALGEGYEVYAVEDCSGGTSITAHEAAISRIVQAGGVRMTWVATMLEWQRDWARKETYDGVMRTVIEHAGVYGQAAEYCYTMVHKAPAYPKRWAAAADGHNGKH